MALLSALTLASSSAPSPAAEKVHQSALINCTFVGKEGSRIHVDAARIIDCLKDGFPVKAEYADIAGPLDLTQLPTVKVSTNRSKPFWGMENPRKELHLNFIERRTGVEVSEVRVVSSTVTITKNSTIQDGIFGPKVEIGKLFAPVVFQQTINLSAATIRGPMRLPFAQFQQPVISQATHFRGEVNLSNARFLENALFSGAVFEQGPVFFSDVVFTRRAVFECIETKDVEIVFDRARFHRDPWFSCSAGADRTASLAFEEAVFEGDAADFNGIHFGNANFREAQFRAGARFIGSIFENAADFSKVRVIGDTVFNDADFKSSAEFTDSKFVGGTVSFDRVRFGGQANFAEATFTGTTDFRDASFGPVTFQYSRFDSRVNFHGAKLPAAIITDARFAAPVIMTAVTFGDPESPCATESTYAVDFSSTSFGNTVDLTAAEFHGAVNLSYTDYLPGNLKVEWSQLSGGVYSGVNDFGDLKGCPQPRLVAVSPAIRNAPLASLYQSLESNFRALGSLSDANAAYAAALDAKAEAQRDDPKTPFRDSAYAFVQLYVFGLVFGYLVFPFRIVLVTAVLFVVVFLVFWLSRRYHQFLIREQAVGLPKVKLGSLPVIDPGAERCGLGQARFWDLFWITFACFLGLEFREIKLVLPTKSRFHPCFVIFRGAGYLLFCLFVISGSRAVPILSDIIDFFV